MMDEQLKLAPHEIQSVVWQKILAHCESQIDVFHKQNEGTLSQDQTMILRGRIKQLRNIISLGEQESPIEE